MVVPAEEQAIASEREEVRDARAEQPAPLAVEEPGPVQQEETGATELIPLAIGEPGPPHQEEGGGAKAAVKYKKVISWKKAGKQARTIIVSVPKEKEEMVDVGVRPKKRGRPRKAPGMDPLDPRKGSVPDPGKGGCADPVNEGAILGKGGPDPKAGTRSVS